MLETEQKIRRKHIKYTESKEHEHGIRQYVNVRTGKLSRRVP